MPRQSSEMRQPSGLCILRPKPEPTDTYSSAAFPNGGTINAFPSLQKNDELDSKAQYTSELLLKTEQEASMSPSDERCRFAIGTVTPPCVGQQERLHACDHCGKSFRRKDDLQRHISFVHLKQSAHSCEQCMKRFSGKSQLQTHVNCVHLKKRPYQCNHCEKAFPLKSNLRTHEQSVHLRERPHKCKYCEKTFSHSNSLRFHERSVHPKQSAHSCEQCMKRFSRKAQLQTHVNCVHLKKRPHQCNYCEKAFPFKCHLRFHEQSVHLRQCTHVWDSGRIRFVAYKRVGRTATKYGDIQGKSDGFFWCIQKCLRLKTADSYSSFRQ
ncbi:unnamed protein product [Dicrocoelium dendriticum]|nr:unnamed protein product [Dicrocoelium dendriticum]